MTREQFIANYHTAVYALFRACRFPSAEARTLTQDVFRRCAGISLDQTSLENALRDILTEQTANPNNPHPLAAFVATTPGAICLSPPSLANAVESLDPSARDALARHYRHHASSVELSRQLKRSPAAIRQLIARARDAVAQCLK